MELIANTHNLLLHNAQRAEQKAIKYNLYCSNLAFKNWQLKFTIKNMRECTALSYERLLPLTDCNTCFSSSSSSYCLAYYYYISNSTLYSEDNIL